MSWLFPSGGGRSGHLTTGTARKIIARTIHDHVGATVNPHLFRALAVKFCLERPPGLLEQRLLLGQEPWRHEEFVRAFAEEAAEQRRDAARAHARWQEDLADVERRLAGVLAAIENGAWSDTLRQHLQALERRKAGLMARPVETPAAPAIAVHPNAAALYRDKVADLEAALNVAEARAEAALALRELIDRVVLTPDPSAPAGRRIELYGDLAEILVIGAANGGVMRRARSRNDSPPRDGSRRDVLSVAAGVGNR